MIRVSFVVASLCFALLGCRPDAETASVATSEAPPPSDAAAADASAADASAADMPPKTMDAKGDTPTLSIALLSGERYELASRRGRWVVINFWATWCAPCLKEMPELDAYDAKRDDLDVVGLAYEEIAPEDMRAFLDKRPVNYPIAIVDVYDPPPAFGTPRGLPMTYLIAPDGRIAERFMGPVTGADLDAAIELHVRANPDAAVAAPAVIAPAVIAPNDVAGGSP